MTNTNSPETIEIAVIGGGGAGLTAALYAARARRKTVVFERRGPVGQIATTGQVENYPGFPDGVEGFDLGQLFQQQAEKHGAEVRFDEVTRLERLPGGDFRVETSSGTVRASAVIYTAGADYNKLGIPGEEEFTGRGVSYCATCDAPFFTGVGVAVVGGGDAALDEGLFVARYASKVHLIHRRDSLRASKVLQERALAEPKFEFHWDTVVTEIEGTDQVTSLKLTNVVTGATSTLAVGGIFVFIGQTPNSDLLEGIHERDRGGHIAVDHSMATAVPGLFAAGDVRIGAARQLVAACGDGATAAIAADHYLTNLTRYTSPAGNGGRARE